MDNLISDLDEALLEQAGVETEREPERDLTTRDERIIAGFEEIGQFFEKTGRIPEAAGDRDLFERIYATRLEAIRASEECRELLEGRDPNGLLDPDVVSKSFEKEIGDAKLLDSLISREKANDLGELVHVRSVSEKSLHEETAQRKPCEDFTVFKLLFEQVQRELEEKVRTTIKFKDNAEIQLGDLFILEGQKAVVAGMGEAFVTKYEKEDRRLRVVYDNGTESDLLLRSLQRALNRDKTSRRISSSILGPLFSGIEEELRKEQKYSGGPADSEKASGIIYVLRSLSEDPYLAKHREVVHKIGVTSGSVKSRIANAEKDPTYLLTPVEIVAEFEIRKMNCARLEQLLHRFFATARLDVELKDRFGFPVEPKEWFLVPLKAIGEAIEKLKEGRLLEFEYDAARAGLVRKKL